MTEHPGGTLGSDPESAGRRWAHYWNGPVATPWVTFRDQLDALFEPLSAAALAAANPRPGQTIIDVGCGCGSTTFELAQRVGISGHVLGVDISDQLLDCARERAKAPEFPQVELILADAASYAFPAPGRDLIFSRLGVMFFGDPVTAFLNLWKALRPDGKILLACPRPFAENPFISKAVEAARPLLPADAFHTTAPGQPGMFSLADPSRIRSILQAAGFHSLVIEPADLPMYLGACATDAAELSFQFGPLPGAVRSAPREIQTAVEKAVANVFAGLQGARGVFLPGAFWIISACA